MVSLLKRGADPLAVDKKGNTPLNCAAKCATLRTVKILVEKGADICAVNKAGQTALDLAEMGREIPRDEDDCGKIGAEFSGASSQHYNGPIFNPMLGIDDSNKITD